MAGDFIIAVTAILISSLRNDNVTIAFSQVSIFSYSFGANS